MKITLDKSSVASKTEGTNFIIGPYKINKTGNGNFNLVATITDGTNALNNAKILKSDKTTEINGANYSEKVKNSIGSTFYISVPVSDNLSKVVLSISGNTTGKTITYWSAPAAQISVTQPIAIVKNETKSFNHFFYGVAPPIRLILYLFYCICSANSPVKSNPFEITGSPAPVLAPPERRSHGWRPRG